VRELASPSRTYRISTLLPLQRTRVPLEKKKLEKRTKVIIRGKLELLLGVSADQLLLKENKSTFFL